MKKGPKERGNKEGRWKEKGGRERGKRKDPKDIERWINGLIYLPTQIFCTWK